MNAIDALPASIDSAVSEGQGRGSERAVIRCIICDLVQYETRSGNCRRCGYSLPQRISSLLLLSIVISPEPPNDYRPAQVVEQIGARIRELRGMRGWKQRELARRANIARPYLGRVEVGAMKPSIGVLEKISEALGVSLQRILLSDATHHEIVEDPFIRAFLPFLRRLSIRQWKLVFKTLASRTDSPVPIELQVDRPRTMRPCL